MGGKDKKITSLGQHGLHSKILCEKKERRKKLLRWNKDKRIWLMVSEAIAVDKGYVGPCKAIVMKPAVLFERECFI